MLLKVARMPKKKTKKAVAKRFKRTAKGKIVYHKPGKGHLLTSKTRKRKRGLRSKSVLSHADTRRIRNMLDG